VSSEPFDEIVALEIALHKNEIRHDRTRLTQLLGNQFKEFGRSGRIYDKASVVSRLLCEPDMDGEIASWGFELVALAPGVVMLHYRSAFRDPHGVASNFALRTSIWQRGDDGGWQMQFHQGTPTNEEVATA
jgi:hypothetical protein